MLVLTRRKDETIVFKIDDGRGEPIVVTVCKIQGDTVRVGIEAPREYRILRGELLPETPSAAHGAPLRHAR